MHVEGDVLALLLPGDLGHDLQSPVLGHKLLLSQLLDSNKPVLFVSSFTQADSLYL